MITAKYMTLKTKNRFLDPSDILSHANLEKGMTVADFGCGNGFYPVAAGKLVANNGTVYAVDKSEEALEATISAAKHANLKNIYTIQHDLEHPGVPIDDNSCDAVILANIIHEKKLQKSLMKETYRVLRSGGKAIIIEWNKHQLPIGPKISERIEPHSLNDILATSGFQLKYEIPADQYHFAHVYVK